MESFSLLKYWRGGGGAPAASAMRSNAFTPAATSVICSASETDEEDLCIDVDDDEGPFFDLEFSTVHDESIEAKEGEDDGEGEGSAWGPDEDNHEQTEFNFSVSSDGSAEHMTMQPEAMSPSDNLLFKRKFIPLEPSSIVIAAAAAPTAEDASSSPKHLPSVSFLKSTTKLRVFMLGLRKHKGLTFEPRVTASTAAVAATVSAPSSTASLKQQQTTGYQNKFFIKFKVEEVPIMSLFTRDHSFANSSSSAADAAKACAVPATKTPPGKEDPTDLDVAPATTEEKKFPMEVVQKYVNKIKPLYVRVSKRYAEKLRHAGHPTGGDDMAVPVGPGGVDVSEDVEPVPVPAQVQSPVPALVPEAETAPTTSAVVKGLPAGLRVVRKHLGKSRSASAAVAAAPPPVPQRRDDSLLQQQDGIQSAIAHCKRSFTAADKGNESPLVRSMSDPGEDLADHIIKF